MLVRANVRNAMKTIMFIKKLDIRKTSGSSAMHHYPRYHKGSIFDQRVHHYHSSEKYPDLPVTVQPTYPAKYSHLPYRYAASTNFPAKYSHLPYRYAASTNYPLHRPVPTYLPTHHHHHRHSKWVLRIPPNEQQLMQRDFMDFTEKVLDSFPNPIEDLIFRL